MPFDIPDTHAFIRCTAAVAILPNIRRKNHRDIDGTLGTLALRFEDIALCVAKPLESCVLVCRHTIFPNTYAEVILLRLCEINIFFYLLEYLCGDTRPRKFPTVSRHIYRFILKALCRRALGVIDIPTAPSPNFRETARVAVVADF